ncbi:unnamed protein product [Meganyctiphanes norvegica]|uniref:Uncharacterized protein n=1 Tax=Meganyctiphanes norvegica TaxID=48144 RepID=A0AAV2PY43_MEGNR
MASLLLLIAPCVFSLASAHSYLEVYTLKDAGGAYTNFSSYQYDLDHVGWDNMVQSVCGTGVWLMYENKGYNSDHSQGHGSWVESFIAPEYMCHNLPSTHYHELSSLRYVGSGYLEDETVTLYHSWSYEGGEALFLKDEDDLSDMTDEVSSFIITGPSPWTFYEDPYYGGIAICVEPWNVGSGKYVGTFNVNDVGLPNNILSSIKKGCFAKTVVKAKPLTIY